MSVLDVILLVVIVVFTLNGLHKGLIRSLVSFVGYVAASLLAAFFGRTGAVFLYDTFFKASLIEKVSDALQQAAGQGPTGQLQALEEGLPGFLLRPLLGDGTESLSALLNQSIEQAAPAVVQALAPAVINGTRMVLTVVLFSVFIVAVGSLTRMLSAVFRLPILRQINSLFGGIFGFLTGGAVVLLLCLLLQLTVPLMKDGLFGITQKDLDSSWVFHTLYQGNPVYSLLPEE